MFGLKAKKELGFTLVETVIALSLGILVMVMVMTIAITSIKHVKSVRNIEKLHSETVFFVDNLNYWIKQSKSLETPSSSTLVIILPNNIEMTIKEENGRIKINDSDFIDEKIEITELLFTKISQSVRVNLSMGIEGGQENISIQTTITKRN